MFQVKDYFWVQDTSTAEDYSYRSRRVLELSSAHQQVATETSGRSQESQTNNTKQRVAKLVGWICLWGLFIAVGFGAVFLVVSALLFIYFSTRKNSGQSGQDKQLSAYSVFNPNFERLDGTLTAEQFEKELKFGPGAIH